MIMSDGESFLQRIESRDLPGAAARSGVSLWPAVGFAACLVALAVDAFVIEPHRVVLERVDIPIWNLPDAFDGYRIAIISDLHYPRWTRREFIHKCLALANDFDPDLIALLGDICDRSQSQPSVVPNLTGLFDGVRAKDGIVGVLGNHDHRFDVERLVREFAKNTPVRLIENTCLRLERAGELLAVGGVGDLWHGTVAPERAFKGVPPYVPRVLLSHNPDLAERMPAGIRVDVQLSGHTHGGQVCLPSGCALHVPSRYGNKFRAGLVQGKRNRVYISRGVASSHHVRFCCPPEVSGITLRKSNDLRHAPWNVAGGE